MHWFRRKHHGIYRKGKPVWHAIRWPTPRCHYLCVSLFCSGGTRYLGGWRRWNSLRFGQFPLFTSPHRGKSSRNCIGSERRSYRDWHRDASRQVPKWQLRRDVRGYTRVKRDLRRRRYEGDFRDRMLKNSLKHQESLYPFHVCWSRLHQDFYGQREGGSHTRSCVCDVPSHQGILRWNGHSDRF